MSNPPLDLCPDCARSRKQILVPALRLLESFQQQLHLRD
jgi:hypothetical protein